MFLFEIMQPESVRDLAGEEVPWIAIAQIAVPALTTIVVTALAGWIITRRNEKYKNTLVKETEKFKTQLSKETERFKTDLAKDIHKFQVLHPERLEVVKDLMSKISVVKADLDLALHICGDPAFYIDDEHQKQELAPVARRVCDGIRLLQARLESEKFMFEDETFGHMEAISSMLMTASGKFILNMYEREGLSFIPALTPNGIAEARKLITVDIPAAREKLQNASRNLLFSE